MYQDKSFLGIIPARGGSKGIPYKNIRILAGKPLLAWTIEEAHQSIYLDRVILSSEDDQIIAVAKQYGCEVPFIRPPELSRDETPGIDPVIHAILTLKEKYDYIVLLQPTSPLRKAHHIDEAIQWIIHRNADSLVSVNEARKSPYWMFSMNQDSQLNPILKHPKAVRRQELPRLFALNGAIYIATPDFIFSNKSFQNDGTVGFLMDDKTSVDIDDELDWLICQAIIDELKFVP